MKNKSIEEIAEEFAESEGGDCASNAQISRDKRIFLKGFEASKGIFPKFNPYMHVLPKEAILYLADDLVMPIREIEKIVRESCKGLSIVYEPQDPSEEKA